MVYTRIYQRQTNQKAESRVYYTRYLNVFLILEIQEDQETQREAKE